MIPNRALWLSQTKRLPALSLATLLFLGAGGTAAAQEHATAQPNETPNSAYGGSLFKAEAQGVSAGFHRWLGQVGTHYTDCIGATLLIAIDDPKFDNHLYVGAVFATAVGQYGDPGAPNLFAAAASTTAYIEEGRSFAGTTALPPLPFSYSTIAARASYRLKTQSFLSGSAYIDLGYGLVGTTNDMQMTGFMAVGSSLIIKVLPSLHISLGLQYRQDIPAGSRIAGFEDLSSLAIYNSFELVKF